MAGCGSAQAGSDGATVVAAPSPSLSAPAFDTSAPGFSSPSSAATGSPTPGAVAAAWQARGVTVQPPASLSDIPPLDGFNWSDGAGPAGTDDPRPWVTAIRRSAAWESWAIRNDQPEFLASFAAALPYDAAVITFLRDARARHARIAMSAPLEVSRVVFRDTAAAEGDAPFLQQAGYPVTPQLFRVEYTSAVSVSATDASGTQTLQVVPYYNIGFAVTGTFIDDPLLGPVWHTAAWLDCTAAAQVLSVCRL